MSAEMDDPDPFVVVWEGPTLEADVLSSALSRALIPVESDAALLPGRTRLLVPRSYRREASEVLTSGSLVPDTPAELFEPSQTWFSPTTRLLLVAVAALVLVGILLSVRAGGL